MKVFRATSPRCSKVRSLNPMAHSPVFGFALDEDGLQGVALLLGVVTAVLHLLHHAGVGVLDVRPVQCARHVAQYRKVRTVDVGA